MLVNWLMSRLQTEEGADIEVNMLYNSYKFEVIESGQDNVSSIHCFIEHLKSLFPEVQRGRKKVGGISQTVYKGLRIKSLTKLNEQDIEFHSIPELMPDFCELKSTNPKKIIFEMDSLCTSNDNKVCKTLQFNDNGTFEVHVANKKVKLETINVEPVFHLNQASIAFAFSTLQRLHLCNGVKYTKSMVVSRFHTLDMWKGHSESFRSLRHVTCSKIVAFNSKTSVCRTCQTMVMYAANKENIENLPKKKNKESTTKSDQIKELFPNAPQEMVAMLLEQSNNVGKHPNGRRWSKEFIVTCLQLFNRSPKCYELLQQAKLLILPSTSVLILYRNAIKQDPGFEPQTFEWMYEEAKRRGLSDREKIGGIIFDEMSVQQDIQLEKNGSVLEMTGFTDLGEEGDMCNQLRKGARNKTMGTHVLQLLYLGLNGFRFPFAYFVTDTVQASGLYALFWKAVSHLHTYGFKVLFTCMDGAQANRSFMHICLGEGPKTYMTPSPCTSQPVIFMMDISHVLKKIRNNILKSGITKQCTRLLRLPNQFEIHWQMFIDFFHWDQQNGLQLHRKLTNEHLYPDSQLKMRNYLAEDILSIEMLHALKVYQESLGEKGTVLSGAIELLEHTSVMVKVFRDMKPIRELNDQRLIDLKSVDKWFETWETEVQQSSMSSKEKSRCLMTYQTMEDIHSCINGFVLLCEQTLQMDTSLYVTPGLANSDVIENVFNQQRSTYNGANTNPSVLQYKKTINNIIIGQNVVSKKANAGITAHTLPYPVAVTSQLRKRKQTCPTEPSSSKKKITVIRL